MPSPAGAEVSSAGPAIARAEPAPAAGRALPAPHRETAPQLPGSGAGQPRARRLLPGGAEEGGGEAGFNPGL